MRWSLACLLIAASGCGLISSSDCTTELRPAIRLVIVDAKTGRNPTIGPTITVRDGAFVVEVYPPAGSPSVVSDEYHFALELPGRYSIEVQAPGYRAWSKTNIVVSSDGCDHVKTAMLTAKLVPLNP